MGTDDDFNVSGHRSTCPELVANHALRTQPIKLLIRECHLPCFAPKVSGIVMTPVATHPCGCRIPRHSPATLTEWYHSKVPEHISRLIGYCLARTTMVVEIVEVAELITKNSYVASLSSSRLLLIFRQRVCPRLRCRLLLSPKSWLAVQGRVLHVPHRKAREFCPALPKQARCNLSLLQTKPSTDTST